MAINVFRIVDASPQNFNRIILIMFYKKNYIILLFIVFNIFFSQNCLAEFSFFKFFQAPKVAIPALLRASLVNTIKNLNTEDPYITDIDIEQGIRPDTEIADRSEIKIILNFTWQDLPNHPDKRMALDSLMAHLINAIFDQDPDINKIRIIIKTPIHNSYFQPAAKLFSITRAAWALSLDNPNFDVKMSNGIARLLALGDYIVLSQSGWQRGY